MTRNVTISAPRDAAHPPARPQTLLRYGLGDLVNGTKWRWHHFVAPMRMPEPVLARYGGLLLSHLKMPESVSDNFPVRGPGPS